MTTSHINLADLDGSNGFRLDGVTEYDYSGSSVSDIGDINGDGFDDIVVGAPGADPNGADSGAGYVVFGKASGFDATMRLSDLDGSNGFRLNGVAAYDRLGRVFSNAGDVNGDGLDDLIIGVYTADPNGRNSGASYVVFGKSSGFSATLELSILDGENGFRLDGFFENNNLGRSVSGAGDVNGDGLDDLIIGAYGANRIDSGSSYIVFGKSSGFDATMDLSSLNGSNGFRLDRAARGDNLGHSVSNAGDVNGDGLADLIISAPDADSNSDSSGSSYVVFGKTSDFDATLDLSGLDGSNGFRLDGEAANNKSGLLVSTAGDVNGDGFDDLIIGAYNIDPYGSHYGFSYVVFGKSSGFDATMDLSNLNGNNGFRLNGVDNGEPVGGLPVGGSIVSSAGDVNGDGFDDLIFGAYRADPSGHSSGSSYVMFGKASGFRATMDLSSIDGNNGFRLDGVFEVDLSGASVSGAGDVNGDGFDDLIIGAWGADSSGLFSGSSYVIFGSSHFKGIVTYPGTSEDDNFIGTPAGERFEGEDGNDIMIGGGGSDVFHGDAGDDILGVSDLDFQFLDGGAGTDTLALIGSDINLNLADFQGKIRNIEAIDLTGSGNNTVTLTLQDLRNPSNAPQTLTVKGNAGDHLAGLSNTWEDGGIQGDFHRFVNRNIQLLVDVEVSTEPFTSGVRNISNLDLNGKNGFHILDGETTNGFSAGDVNGDGFDDFIILGSHVVFGKASGFSATMELSSIDGSNGFNLNTDRAYSDSVSTAGDVNGDGFDDLIIGSRGDYYSNFPGTNYVIFGKASGFDMDANITSVDGKNGFRIDVNVFSWGGSPVDNAGDVNGDGLDDVIVRGDRGFDIVFGKSSRVDAVMNVSSIDGSNGFHLLSGNGLHLLGINDVTNAGDVNGDGFDDLIASGTETSDSISDFSYVVFGKASGFSATMDLSSLDGSNGFRLEHQNQHFNFDSVSSAGDMNGDGFSDVIIGDQEANSSYVVFGKASGFSATMNLSSLDGNSGFRVDGELSGDHSGRLVKSAGDFNGDGFDDVIIDGDGLHYVVYGKATGFDAVINLLDLNGDNGFRLDGMNGVAGAHFSSLNGVGDINNDGFDDLFFVELSAPRYDSSSSYVIFGKSDFADEVDFPGTPGNDILTGTSAAESFEGGDGNDRMIGRGGSDELHGEAGDDYIRVSDLNFQLVDGGDGRDTLGLGGNGLNLDLTGVNGRISDIETIYLYGTGDNTLTLTALDVVNLSSTSNVLRVNGNEGDRIVGLGSGWDDGGVHGKFHTYTQGEAVLLVGVNVATDFV